MSKPVKITIFSFVLAVVCWLIEIVAEPSAIIAVAAVVLSIIFLCFLSVSICSWIAKKREKDISAYKIFAAADCCIGILVTMYAVYDIKTDVGFMAGMVGFLLLLFVIPIVLVLLVADFIIWKLKKREFKGWK